MLTSIFFFLFWVVTRTYMQWLMGHQTFQRNPLYIAGDSYSGIVVPIIVQKISDGNFCQSNLYKYLFIIVLFLTFAHARGKTEEEREI
jgi:ABC-type transport system involved in cytochrome c biogenesis permease subunit